MVNGDSNFVKNFANLYDAVLQLEAIGRKISHLHLHSLELLCSNLVETQHSKNFSLLFIFDMFKRSLLDILLLQIFVLI